MPRSSRSNSGSSRRNRVSDGNQSTRSRRGRSSRDTSRENSREYSRNYNSDDYREPRRERSSSKNNSHTHSRSQTHRNEYDERRAYNRDYDRDSSFSTPSYNRRSASRPINRNRKAKVNTTSLVILGFIAVVIIVLVVVGIKSVVSLKSTTTKEGTSVLSATEEPEVTATPAPTATPKPEAATEKDISNATITKYDTLLTVDGTAYEYYKFSQDNATATIEAVNKMATSLGVNTYAMMIPSGIDIMLPLSLLDELASETSDQQKAETYILSSLDSSVKTIATYDQLKAHCDEDLYFNSDNHISGLCGYYLYQQWASVKGVNAVALSSCSTTSYDNFYGNIANETGYSLDEDTVTVYDPNGNFTYTYQDDYGETQDGSVFVDVTDYYSSQKYQAFLGGVHTRSQIQNNSTSNTESCVLVIDSNGTSIAPFIATHYRNTYIVDYRYASETDSLSKIVSDTGATDVIFCLSMGVTASGSLSDGLTTLCQ